VIETTTRLLPIAIACSLGFAACGRGAGEATPARPPPAPAPAAQPPPRQTALARGSGWRVTVRPVFSGVDTNGADGTVTVESWEDGPATVRYEFPAFVPRAVHPDVLAASEGLVRREPAKGTISVAPAAAHEAAFTPTSFWRGGEAAAPGPLLWMPPDVTAALRTRGEATMRFAALPGGLSMRAEPAGGDGVVRLSVVDKGEIVLAVDGTPTRFPAFKLEDDAGGTYTLLDSQQNPLVVRFRFGSSPVVGGRKLVTAARSGFDVIALTGPKPN
jgi:hypothetical protein